MITDEFRSSWDFTKSKSTYHYDTKIMDPQFDTVIRLGHIEPTWAHQLTDIVANSAPASWRTRGDPTKPSRPEEELSAEEYDLERAGYNKDTKVTNLNWAIPDNLQQISDAFGLYDPMTRIHVQHPGQVWNLHLDKLEKWNREDPATVVRYMIQLTDWQPGQFWSYGNYLFTGWTAGDVTTFDWQNVPHSTANAGHSPRVTLQVTGVKTEKTESFLATLK
jgi:hypothetical protein